METQSSYSGTCFCGAVEVTVKGSPVAMGYCHRDSCRVDPRPQVADVNIHVDAP